MKVWVISREWNQELSEAADGEQIVGVYATEAAARMAQHEEQQQLVRHGWQVYEVNPPEDDPDAWQVDVHCHEHDVK